MVTIALEAHRLPCLLILASPGVAPAQPLGSLAASTYYKKPCAITDLEYSFASGHDPGQH